jgi:hypothetical protein
VIACLVVSLAALLYVWAAAFVERKDREFLEWQLDNERRRLKQADECFFQLHQDYEARLRAPIYVYGGPEEQPKAWARD